jgi:glycosyltransferase involved in cell wall biosynthesis
LFLVKNKNSMARNHRLFDQYRIDALQENSFLKSIIRFCWKLTLTLKAIVSYPFAFKDSAVQVFYGGARAGDIGGPLVKVKRLQQFYPEYTWNYNIVYALSNAAYLSPFAINLLSKKKIPIVLNQNGVFYPGWYAGNWRGMNAQMANAYHRADYVFWQSNFCRRAANKFLGQREGPGEILFNAVDTNLFAPKDKKSSEMFTFLLTGNINKHLSYRLESSLLGLKIARDNGLDAKINIGGSLSKEVLDIAHALIKKLRLSKYVIFLGQYSQKSAPAIYQSADAYIMTKYLDPCPNTVLEAMSCGLPIIYSDSGGIPELVGEAAGVGLAVPEVWESAIYVPSIESIAEGMLLVSKNHAVMKKEARRRAVDMFDIVQWIEKHDHIFRKLLELRS